MKFVSFGKLPGSYEPLHLIQRLKKDCDTYIVDKSLVENLPAFYATLNADYKWDYTTDAKLTTVYFEHKDGIILGGVYCLSTHKKITRVQIASATRRTPYIYPEKDIAEMIRKIEK